MIVDAALQQLEATGHPIRVGMIGAGATGGAIALQLAAPVPVFCRWLLRTGPRSTENAHSVRLT